MTDLPTTTINQVTRDAWKVRAKAKGDFCNLDHDEQEQLARALGQTIDPNLTPLGRMEWATRIERSLANDWAIPGSAEEVGLGSGRICMS